MEIIVGKTAGFCYGVKRAVEGTLKEIELNDKKEIYCLGELVHNKQVIKKLEKKGINIISTTDEINNNSKVIIRAHGIKKDIYENIKNNNCELVDFTCPNVLRIHDIAEEYSNKNYYIFVIGSKTHPEVVGTVSYCGKYYSIIENEDDINDAFNKFKNTNIKKLLVIVQTTFSKHRFETIKDLIKSKLEKNIVLEIKDTICLATEQRQEETEKMSKKVELMIIIGGENSSNTKKLYEIAKKHCLNAICIETSDDLKIKDINNISRVGIMAGASTPQESIDKVIEKLKKVFVYNDKMHK